MGRAGRALHSNAQFFLQKPDNCLIAFVPSDEPHRMGGSC